MIVLLFLCNPHTTTSERCCCRIYTCGAYTRATCEQIHKPMCRWTYKIHDIHIVSCCSAIKRTEWTFSPIFQSIALNGLFCNVCVFMFVYCFFCPSFLCLNIIVRAVVFFALSRVCHACHANCRELLRFKWFSSSIWNESILRADE